MKRERLVQIVAKCNSFDAHGRVFDSIALLSSEISENLDADLLYQRGIRFTDIGDFESALQDFSAAIRIKPTVKLLIERGCLLSDQLDDAVKGQEDFYSALDLSPENYLVYQCLCVHCQRHGRLDEAILHAYRLVMIDSSNATSHASLGQCFLLRHQYEEAEKELAIATSLNPESSSTWHDLGCTLRNLGELSEAKKCIEKSIALEETAGRLITLATILLKLEEREQAIEALNHAKMFELDEGNTLLVDGYLSLAKRGKEVL